MLIKDLLIYRSNLVRNGVWDSTLLSVVGTALKQGVGHEYFLALELYFRLVSLNVVPSDECEKLFLDFENRLSQFVVTGDATTAFAVDALTQAPPAFFSKHQVGSFLTNLVDNVVMVESKSDMHLGVAANSVNLISKAHRIGVSNAGDLLARCRQSANPVARRNAIAGVE